MPSQNQTNSSDTASTRDPLVWVVTGYRAGEQTQILALAEALGWPYEIKRLSYSSIDWLPGLLRLKSLVGIDRSSSSRLAPPWPDLVISAGMRNEPICRWIRAQSGNRAQLVQVGRPWVRIEEIDLVITTPQYRLPGRDNVLQNTGTLNLVSKESLASAADRWSDRLGRCRQPLTGIVLGGNSGPYTFGPKAAARMATILSKMARRENGSLAITTSARTSSPSIDAFLKSIDSPYFLYRWSQDSADKNPYLGILSLSDRIVVTSDSVSMISEAVATGKPVCLYDLEEPGLATDAPPVSGRDFRVAAHLYRLLMRYGHKRLTRDLTLFHQKLIESGRATWLGEAASAGSNPGLDDLERAVLRVQKLLSSDESPVKTDSGHR
jgi:mitochondrial fission protein ELM1